MSSAFVIGLLLLFGWSVPSVYAGNGGDAVEPTAEERQAAEQLMAEYLPEVRKLVEVLRKRAPQEYQKAIRDLARSGRKLEATKKRDRLLFELEVDLLKVQVRIDMAAAQLQREERDHLKTELRGAIVERARLRLARMERQRELLVTKQTALASELETLDRQLQQRKSQTEETTRDEYESLLRRAEQQRQRLHRGET